MTGESRTADVVAIGDVERRLGKETFERVLLKRPEIATELSEKLAKRRVELLAVRDGLDRRRCKGSTSEASVSEFSWASRSSSGL